MKIAPLSIGTIHFIGIGGIGMSGIAEILHKMGHQVQGSDLGENANTERLRKEGIPIFIGHRAENIKGASYVVPSSAVQADNPELKAARLHHIPVIPRAEMLGEVMRFKPSIAVAGTHGKTTTTSLVSNLLSKGKLDPTIINGGIINSLSTNALVGSGNWMVVEADESDGTFIKIPATIAVITNIEAEHMEHFGSFENLRQSFLTFATQIPFYGFSVLCLDHPVVQSLPPEITTRRFITYGTHPDAQCRVTNIKADAEGMTYDVLYKRRDKDIHLKQLHLPLHGEHNVLNSLAAIAISLEFHLSEETLRKALTSFEGVKRRFTKTGTVKGITIIDDYGHHPTEIKAVLKAARAVTKHKVIAVVQPHRYSRLKNLFQEFSECFKEADALILAPVYPAGESPLPGIDHLALKKAAALHFKGPIESIESPTDLAPLIHKMAKPGDYVICLGAGSITTWAHALPTELEEFYSQKKGA